MKMPEWRHLKKADEAAEYILSNWTADELRLKGKERILGSRAESQSNILIHYLTATITENF